MFQFRTHRAPHRWRGTGLATLAASAVIAFGAALAQDATKPAPSQKKPADDKAETSYSVGVSMGDQLRRLGITAEMLSAERLAQGVRDALAGKAGMSQEHQQRLVALVESAHANLAKANKEAARKFLAENGKRKDVKTTKSGLQYRVISSGKGASPKPTDEVTVHYTGKLLDGTQFDSSVARGEPVTFPANGVIQGWQEALVLMKPGDKWELFIPPELGYDMASPPSIPPGSLLMFEVELLSVQPAK